MFKSSLTFQMNTKVSIWKPLSLGELNPIIFNKQLTHLGLKASEYSTNLHHHRELESKSYFLHFAEETDFRGVKTTQASRNF